MLQAPSGGYLADYKYATLVVGATKIAKEPANPLDRISPALDTLIDNGSLQSLYVQSTLVGRWRRSSVGADATALGQEAPADVSPMSDQ